MKNRIDTKKEKKYSVACWFIGGAMLLFSSSPVFANIQSTEGFQSSLMNAYQKVSVHHQLNDNAIKILSKSTTKDVEEEESDSASPGTNDN